MFEDEASLANSATVSYKWSVKGKQPKIEQQQNRRERCTLSGCVDPSTGVVITYKSKKGNTLSFFRFLMIVCMSYPDKKVYMILDNVRYHHAKRLKPILERYKHRIELIFLPAYSPDLNPMERIWWYMRKKITHNRGIKSLEERLKDFDCLFKDFECPNDLGRNLCNLIVNL